MVTSARFTTAEYFVVQQGQPPRQAYTSLYTPRQMALEDQVIAKMNEEERQFVRELAGEEEANELMQRIGTISVVKNGSAKTRCSRARTPIESSFEASCKKKNALRLNNNRV